MVAAKLSNGGCLNIGGINISSDDEFMDISDIECNCDPHPTLETTENMYHCYVHDQIVDACLPVLYSTEPGVWHQYTCTPKDESYEKNYQWFQDKFMDSVRKKCGKRPFFITRETIATKTHINVLVKTDCVLFKNTKRSDVHYHLQCVKNTFTDLHRVFMYFVKEAKSREFIKYRDYNVSRLA